MRRLASTSAPAEGVQVRPAVDVQHRGGTAASYASLMLVDLVAIPVNVLWGTDDAWIPIQTGHRLAQLITDADYTEVPESGHLIQYDAPVALANAVQAWLTKQTGSPPSR